MEKIKMQTPLVEMDGDEMTRILWQIIKDELLTPYLELNTEYYDLGLEPEDTASAKVRLIWSFLKPLPGKSCLWRLVRQEFSE